MLSIAWTPRVMQTASTVLILLMLVGVSGADDGHRQGEALMNAHWSTPAFNLPERRLRVKALRAQRLEMYKLSRHHQIGDDVLREVLGELDLNEANLGLVK